MLKTLGMISAAAAILASMAVADTNSVYTLSVQQVPKGAAAKVAVTRAGFLTAVQQQNGLTEDNNFVSFFTFPTPPTQTVIVGFTEWESGKALAAAQKNVMGSPAAGAYMQAIDMQALLALVTADGSKFELSEMISDPDTVVEFAVRRPKEGMEEEFVEKRKAFFDAVAQHPGHLFSQEFVMPEGATELVGKGSDWTAVLIGWDSTAAYQTALGALGQQPEFGAFQGTIEALTYHATVPQ